MYNAFFGFRERPFKLVPNPAYLFLSRSHEEALAHLSYAVSQGDGFVEITGEVGTGKTTLCRAFLNNLDDTTVAAYIFNPKLNSVQLLKAINDEFNIPSETLSAKILIDRLNRFLMAQKANGKKVVLIIDEAQNLRKDVIEQIRLLSNLETNTSKLIQIILVGQPELGELLDSYELRQLTQRITLHWHITPMTYKETIDYIRHRLHVASFKLGAKFTRSAFGPIYRYSGGTPRLINIVCDRSLLIAYGLNRHTIGPEIIRSAIREVTGKSSTSRFSLLRWRRWIFMGGALALIGVGLVMGRTYLMGPAPDETTDGPQAFKIVAQERAEAREPVRTAPVIKDPDFEKFLKNEAVKATRQSAMQLVLELWKADAVSNPYFKDIEDDHTYFRVAANQNGFAVYDAQADMGMIQKLNLPAIVSFHLPDTKTVKYLVLTEIDGDQYTFRWGADKTDRIVVIAGVAASYSGGVGIVPWKNFLNLTGVIPVSAPEDSVIMLKTLLKEIGYEDVVVNGDYEDTTRKYIREIQKKNGIDTDGIVDNPTKIAIYNEKKSLAIPHLKKTESKKGKKEKSQ